MPTYTWNVVFYAIAGDAAEEAEVAQHLAGMAAALTTDQCAVSAQINTRSAMTRHWITRGAHRRDLPATPVNTSSAAALSAFLDAAADQFDARSTLLVMCGHGNAVDIVRGYMREQLRWLRTAFDRPVFPPRPNFPKFPGFPKPEWHRWGPNPVTGTFLGNVALRDGIVNSKAKRVDVLGLNACWMGMLEVMHAFRDVASLQVASQVRATRWPYRAILKALSASPQQSAEQLAGLIVKCVHDDIAANKRTDSVAAIRGGAHLEDLAGAVGDYARAVTPLLASSWSHVVTALVSKAKRFEDPHQADLSSLVSELGKNDAAAQVAANEVKAQLARTIVAKAVHADRGNACGLSLFCPIKKDLDLNAAYTGLAFASNPWADFLKKWQSKLPNHA